MTWNLYNPNPRGAKVGDCTVRALARALNQPWDKTYMELCVEGFAQCDMPSANAVWGNVLKRHGFKRCPVDDDTTVDSFCTIHTKGVYVLALSGHVVCVENGNVYDTWNSTSEIILYYFEKMPEKAEEK